MLQLDYQENGRVTGQLVLKNTPRFAPLRAKPSVISIIPAFANDRAEVEKFITDIYAQAYDASIAVHYPILMSVRNAQGRILAATGFRSAACEKLFLENYLDAPIEALAGVPREKIVEVGNLASNGGGASLFLFAAISAYLHNKGFEKAVVTGTNFLEQRFHEIGLDPVRLAVADQSRLAPGDEDWGRYYETQPHVLSGSLPHAYRRLQDRLGAEYHERPPALYPRLHYRD
jgi:hypothetical protein